MSHFFHVYDFLFEEIFLLKVKKVQLNEFNHKNALIQWANSLKLPAVFYKGINIVKHTYNYLNECLMTL